MGFRGIFILSGLAVLATPAYAAEPGLLTAPHDGVAYAVEAGCLHYLREGGNLSALVAGHARPMTEGGRRVEKIYGLGRVTIEAIEDGGCRIEAGRGDGAVLREAVVDALAHSGIRTQTFADYVPELRGRMWSYVREEHCFRMYDRVYLMTLESSADGSRLPLRVTMRRDDDGAAARRGLCTGQGKQAPLRKAVHLAVFRRKMGRGTAAGMASRGGGVSCCLKPRTRCKTASSLPLQIAL